MVGTAIGTRDLKISLKLKGAQSSVRELALNIFIINIVNTAIDMYMGTLSHRGSCTVKLVRQISRQRREGLSTWRDLH